jgi:hypothetical protein
MHLTIGFEVCRDVPLSRVCLEARSWALLNVWGVGVPGLGTRAAARVHVGVYEYGTLLAAPWLAGANWL